MAFTNKTANYDLPQYIASDQPTYLGDFNEAMRTIDSSMESNRVAAAQAGTGMAEANANLDKAQTDVNNAQTQLNALAAQVQKIENDSTTIASNASQAFANANAANQTSQTAVTTASQAVQTAQSANNTAANLGAEIITLDARVSALENTAPVNNSFGLRYSVARDNASQGGAVYSGYAPNGKKVKLTYSNLTSGNDASGATAPSAINVAAGNGTTETSLVANTPSIITPRSTDGYFYVRVDALGVRIWVQCTIDLEYVDN